jgi:hypothetical protein
MTGMRPPGTVKRYALARPGPAQARREEGVKRLRLVRMEAIAERDREREPSRDTSPLGRAESGT